LLLGRTENPCVPGSIPGGTTETRSYDRVFCFMKCLWFPRRFVAGGTEETAPS